MMKRSVLLALGFVMATFLLAGTVFAIGNPAAVYCKDLGYQYEIRESGNQQIGVCIFTDGSECDDWKFLEGKCGKEYSICARQGYEIKTKNDGGEFSSEYAVCVKKGTEVPVVEMAKLNEKLGNAPKMARPEARAAAFLVPPPKSVGLPATFSWRNYSNEDWMTQIKNQGSCGSCWAFAAVGAMEAKYNIQQNNSRLDPNISEEYLVSDCHSYSHYQTCCGGWHDIALAFIRDSGISDRACFPYADTGCSCGGSCSVGCTYNTGDNCSNTVCSDRCSDYSSRLWGISGFGYPQTITDSQAKQYLVDYGPLAVSIRITGMIPDSNGVGFCSATIPDHAVVLVGYNDTGSYWILKNSWGPSYQDNGYFKIAYGQCNVTDDVAYVLTVNPPNYKPTITLNSPAPGYSTQSNLIAFNSTVFNRNSTASICDLIINGAQRNTTAASNATPVVMTANLAEGAYSWYVNCWENSIGIINSSETRTASVDQTPPAITIVVPLNNTTTNSDLFNISYSENVFWTAYSLDNGANVSVTDVIGWSGTLPIVSDGPHNLTVYANDSAGNANWTAIQWLRDTSPPDMIISSPGNNTNHSAKWVWANLILNGTGSWCGVSLNNGTNQSMTNSSGNWNVNLTVPDGQDWVQFSCNDTLGNAGTSTPIFFTIDSAAPAISNMTVSNITDASAIISWQTDEQANTGLIYGTNSTNLTVSAAINNTNSTYHFINLTGLLPATSYMFRANNTDWLGNSAVDSIRWFTTTNNVEATINASNQTNFTFNATINGTLQTVANLTVVTNTTLNATISVFVMLDNPTASNISTPFVIPRYIIVSTNNTLNATVLNWVIVKIFYNDSDILNTTDESSLRLYRYNETSSVWQLLPGGVDTVLNYVWGNSSLLSDFGIGGLKVNGQSCSAASECSGGYCCSGSCAASACYVPPPSGGSSTGTFTLPPPKKNETNYSANISTTPAANKTIAPPPPTQPEENITTVPTPAQATSTYPLIALPLAAVLIVYFLQKQARPKRR